MFKNFLSLLFAAILFSGLAQAELSTEFLRLISTAEGKVGIAFIDLKGTREVRVNGDNLFPAASVAKVPVMAAAYHLADSGKLDLGQKILFIEGDKLGGSGVLQWMKGGVEYTLWNLIRLMIVLSDNTATKLVVDNVGLPAINDYLKGIGLKNTVIVDPTMLKEPPASDINRTTPLDMARLMVKIQKAEGFSPKSRKEMLAFMRNQRYRWGIWRGVPPGTVVANKTGNLEGILNDVGIIYTKKGNYVLSIFTWGFKKQRQARLLINEISRVTYEEYTGEKVERAIKAKKAIRTKRQKVIKRKLRRRPSAKLRRRSGRRGSVSDHRSRTYRRR
jgi:beta-lactamase class A